MPHTYKYPRPSVTADAVVFGVDAAVLRVLLIQRKAAPFKGSWALPGGFVQMGESLDDAARRELQEETGIAPTHLEQLYTFGEPNRDPRGRVITVAYVAMVRPDQHPATAGSDASLAQWFPVDALPDLAFDHRTVVEVAVARIRGKLRFAPIGFGLLPETFTLGDLQDLYETILGRGIDTSNFRKKVLTLGVLKREGERRGQHRPAPLYSFNQAAYDRLVKRGINFEI